MNYLCKTQLLLNAICFPSTSAPLTLKVTYISFTTVYVYSLTVTDNRPQLFTQFSKAVPIDLIIGGHGEEREIE